MVLGYQLPIFIRIVVTKYEFFKSPLKQEILKLFCGNTLLIIPK
jgi:hypothetical protein